MILPKNTVIKQTKQGLFCLNSTRKSNCFFFFCFRNNKALISQLQWKHLVTVLFLTIKRPVWSQMLDKTMCIYRILVLTIRQLFNWVMKLWSFSHFQLCIAQLSSVLCWCSSGEQPFVQDAFPHLVCVYESKLVQSNKGWVVTLLAVGF